MAVAVVTITHSSILKWLQKSDPMIDVMRPVFNLEPKYRVTILTREEWTRRPGTPPRRARLVYGWVQDCGGEQVLGLWASCRKNAQHLSSKTCHSLSG